MKKSRKNKPRDKYDKYLMTRDLFEQTFFTTTLKCNIGINLPGLVGLMDGFRTQK